MVFNRSLTEDVFDRLGNLDDSGELDHPPGPASAPSAEHDEIETPTSATDDGAGEEQSEGDAPAPTRSRVSRLWRRVRVRAGIVVLLAAIALAAFLGWQLKQQHDTDAAGHAALAAARAYAIPLTSVDYQKIDENFAQVMNGATGEFKDMYSQSAGQLRQVLIDNKAVSHGTVVDSAIKSATKTKVEVLMFVDQSITNSVNPEPRIDRSRVTMTMEQIDSRWLASKIDIN
jgi:Mce-associated membrane protein